MIVGAGLARRKRCNLFGFAAVFLLLTGAQPSSSADDPPQPATSSATAIGELPQGVASFGATRLGDYVYVYSGHTGKTHVYSFETTSRGFFRVSLSHGGPWEPLPAERPAQGLALVAGTTELYRIGGMHAVNASGQPRDLHSLSEVAAYHPDKRTWRKLPDLPEPRSSHRAAVLDDQLYVFGGWSLNGGETGTWLEHGAVLNLKNEKEGWKPVTQPEPVRALDVIEYRNTIWMIGGLLQDGGISKKIHIFHPSDGSWAQGPELPGMPANGNGIAATVAGKDLILSCMDGKVYRLSQDQMSWDAVGQLSPSRIHHRLIGDTERVLAIGGAAKSGHLNSAVFIPLPRGK